MSKTINQLSSVDTVVAGDNSVIYSSSNGDARKASMTVLQAYMQASLDFSVNDFPQFVTQIAPGLAAGFSVQVTEGSSNIFLILGGSTSATGTIVLPTWANVIDGQEILVSTAIEVTTLTVDDNGATTIIGSPTTIAAGGFFRLRYDVTSTSWYRVG